MVPTLSGDFHADRWHLRRTPAVTGRSEQRELLSGALRCSAPDCVSVFWHRRGLESH
jgi:hypothetical protein